MKDPARKNEQPRSTSVDAKAQFSIRAVKIKPPMGAPGWPRGHDAAGTESPLMLSPVIDDGFAKPPAAHRFIGTGFSRLSTASRFNNDDLPS